MEYVYKIRVGRNLYSYGGRNKEFDNPDGKIWTSHSNVRRHLAIFNPEQLQRRYPNGFEVIKYMLVETE